MDVPAASDPRWSELITSVSDPGFEFLAARIFMGRAKAQLKQDGSPTNVSKLVGQLHALYSENARLPKVQRDLAKIFSGAA